MERYTKQEVDGLFVAKADMVSPPSLDGYATEQYVDDNIARIPAADLSAYAKVADKEQGLLAKTVVAQGYGFGGEVTPSVAVTYTDTGAGYGERLVLATAADIEYLVYQSDLEPLNALLPRIDALESKQAPSEMDLSAFAKLSDATQTIVASAVEASRVRFDATRSVVMLQSGGKERPVYRDGAQNNALAFVSELAGLCTIADAATQIALCAKKAETYTKTECDTKFLTLVDVNGVYAFAAETYTKVEVDAALKKYVSTNFLMTTVLPTYFTKTESDARYTNFLTIDQIKQQLAGGVVVPADVPWTACPNSNNGVFARCLNGVVYLRGALLKSIASGWTANAFQLPAEIPAPIREMVIPLAAKNSTSRVYSYTTFAVNRQVGISCDASVNNVWFDAISYPAYD
jgi:hypothetical protein